MKDKVIALVTGANRGIGVETVKQLADLGHVVIMTARSINKGLKSAQILSKQYQEIEFIPLDVGDLSSIRSCVTKVQDKFGKLDILVNNAAINYDDWNTPSRANMTEVRSTIETNLIGPWVMIQQFLPLLRKSKKARIVNVSSQAGSLNGMTGGTPAYSITKAGLNVLTIKFAAELRSEGILVNSVCPGWVRTDMGGPSAPRHIEEGAKCIVWGATLPDDGPTGGFFRDGKRISW
jgi:NAD(P)-dependent dehydrogenase (short-subunit alcohol dehydrogenase family)